MKLNDAVLGAIFLALSLAVLWDVRTYPNIPGQNVGPNAFPGLVAAILAGCSIALIARGFLHRAARGQHDGAQRWLVLQAWTRSPRHRTAFGLTVAMLVGYVLFAESLGFLVCGMLLLVVLMLALRVRPVVLFTVAPIATFTIHLIFYKGLRVPLPWGIVPILY